jgi:5-methylthioadenosine/S-adenosylhomocysteine deaminase
MTPVMHGVDFNVAAHLVFSASGHDVADVWIDGRRIVERGRVVTIDADEIRGRAQAAAEELFARRAGLSDAPAAVKTDP